MIFIANTLALNGGTTFLLRMCRELNRRGTQPVILVLFGHDSSAVAKEIGKIAKVIILKDLIYSYFSLLSIKQFGVFLPLDRYRIRSIFGSKITSFHVMGIFGLIVAKRLSGIFGGVPITVGVYHQNEFMFSAYPCYFVRWVSESLSKLPGTNMIFFNEGNRRSYANKFNLAFNSAQVLPIGVELPINAFNQWEQSHVPFLLMSVGNLVEFKTYNMHVINCLHELRKNYRDICYEIYGEGEELKSLQQRAKTIGVSDLVKFCGRLNYKDFNSTVARAHVFVGSGTSILEAASLGVPAIVGIESIMEPVTYGFISDVVGFGYNEAGLEMPLVKILDCIKKGFTTDGTQLSLACSSKAQTFGVGLMVDGFMIAESSAELQEDFSAVEIQRLFISFVLLATMDVLGIDRRFSRRRNQSA